MKLQLKNIPGPMAIAVVYTEYQDYDTFYSECEDLEMAGWAKIVEATDIYYTMKYAYFLKGDRNKLKAMNA